MFYSEPKEGKCEARDFIPLTGMFNYANRVPYSSETLHNFCLLFTYNVLTISSLTALTLSQSKLENIATILF